MIRGVKRADQKLYYDDWWNGRESRNPNFELDPTEELHQAYIKFKIIMWPEYVKKFTDEINNNLKAQSIIETTQYDGTVLDFFVIARIITYVIGL